MAVKVLCHWGMAEDVCLVIELESGAYPELWGVGNGTAELRMTQTQAVDLVQQLQAAIDRCDAYEKGFDNAGS